MPMNKNIDECFDIFTDESTVPVISPLVSSMDEELLIERNNYGDTIHEIVYPNGKTKFELLPPSAMNFPFELDLFQKISISAIKHDESVLVSAHTSSGKTVVAEYSIAMALLNKQRVIYTSPIKALSNQKYRELSNKFGDVGLMTGDTTINPEASCIVMTTEILRNMFYRGNEIMREIHWVIFDEIHYMKDRERGVVWEETIILLPSHVRAVFLSATIPNSLEFAKWVATIHKMPMHVVYTEKRPIPLIHYTSPLGGDGMYKIKDDEKFNIKNYTLACKGLTTRRKNAEDIKTLIYSLVEREYLPVIVFSFRRKECEEYATTITDNFLNEEEKETVRLIFENALKSLRSEDRSLPLIQNILPLLLRGVGIHHSGLLPIIKEVVEILFQENLLKVLFATETFSIGLNMPARAVIFTSLSKYDGIQDRIVSSGEYIQMSGRAGRRGLDKKGVVISLLSENITLKEAKELFSGKSDKLDSAFHLSYNMILNLLRVEGLDPLFLLERSFFHFQKKEEIKKVEKEIKRMYNYLQENKREGYEDLLIKLKERENIIMEKNTNRKIEREHYKIGRVVDVIIPRNGPALRIKNGVITKMFETKAEITFHVDDQFKSKIFPLNYIEHFYQMRLKVINAETVGRKYQRIVEDCDDAILKINKEIEKMDGFIPWTSCYICDKKTTEECIDGKCLPQNEKNEFFYYERLKDEYNEKNKKLRELTEIYHMEEYKKMVQVLRRLDYYNDDGITVKGRVAAEISTGDELLLTEIIFNGDFLSLPLENILALLSCTIFEEKSDVVENNKKDFEIITNTLKKLTNVFETCSLRADYDELIKKYSAGLMNTVKSWVGGATFLEITNKTNVFEGSIIRCFRRLEELLRQLSSAARAIGNTELENIFSSGISKIKRDIVFANSLYL
ncbi:ATP-dependent RNA helicase [Spraguea lophii 42_110]|uniref:ATP-dependent RNA helicase n=1 Tax=Spraguea lophii (strain 42_110) TaxID=1358809 RepID=S7W5M8_SPRLO|nr:ATP-dependent RNA helicase [Spraguea lophii 42_110]